MASGPNWKRPWEHPSSSQDSTAHRPNAPPPPPLEIPLSRQTQFAEQGGDRTLPPIISPQYTTPTSVQFHSSVPTPPHQSPIISQNPFNRSLPPSPKRRRISHDQNADSLAYAKWLETTNAAGGQVTGAGVAPLSGDFSKSQARQSRPAQSPRRAGERLINVAPPIDPTVQRSIQPTSVLQCENCGRLQGITREIVQALTTLDRELHSSAGLAASPARVDGSSMQPPNLAQAGLKDSLDWIVNVLHSNIGIAKSRNTGGRAPFKSDTSPAQSIIDDLRRRIDGLERERDDALFQARGLLVDDARSSDISTSYGDQHQRRKSLLTDPSPILHSPIRSTTYPQTPMGLPLPRGQGSPGMSVLSTVPPAGPPVPQPLASPRATHLQDLQHKVSTKTLALQTLQQEHDHLLSALSRSQTRCAALERKFQASDAEINNLTEERIKLGLSVEALESQVESLMQARDDARNQSVANGGQYMKIMSQASKLEAQASADKRKWKADQESWASERTTFENQIARLEKERAEAIDMAVSDASPNSERAVSESSDRSPLSLRKTSIINAATLSPPLATVAAPILPPTTTAAISTTTIPSLFPATVSGSPITSPPTSAPRLTNQPSTESARSQTSIPIVGNKDDDILENGTLEQLRNEVVRLRHSCAEMEGAVNDLRTEGQRIDQVMRKYGTMGKRVSAKAEQIRAIAANAKASMPVSQPATTTSA